MRRFFAELELYLALRLLRVPGVVWTREGVGVQVHNWSPALERAWAEVGGTRTAGGPESEPAIVWRTATVWPLDWRLPLWERVRQLLVCMKGVPLPIEEEEP